MIRSEVLFLVLACFLGAGALRAAPLDMPISGYCGDGQITPQETAVVLGPPDGGGAQQAGVLEVHSGPGRSYRKIDALQAGDVVSVLARSGQWRGVVFGPFKSRCRGSVWGLDDSSEQGWVPVEGLRDLKRKP